ncbi:MAG: phosphotransferase [Clostridia bacterium]|nr:phosphotransferase [Clostridia bacterium]
MTGVNPDVFSIASHFRLSSQPETFSECTVGHINSTYFIYCEDGGKYVLQRINTSVFKDPDVLMHNIAGVTSHIRKKLFEEGADEERGTLQFCETNDSKQYFRDSNGDCWRIYRFIDNVLNLQSANSTEVFRKVGNAFGHFQKQLSDYDVSLLFETIPDFHNTVSRYNDLLTAVNKNAAGRLAGVREELDFVVKRKKTCAYITDKIASGMIPVRVTHNDTKLNNILLDEKTLEPVCVIDLDTIMPGSVLYDFGDAIRFGASNAAEDETDLQKVFIRTEMFEAFADGFITGIEHSLTKEEIHDLPMGAIVITLETGIRFLTDYLNGDTYFRIRYPEHNLDRARNQFRLVRDMENKLPELKKIVEKFI